MDELFLIILLIIIIVYYGKNFYIRTGGLVAIFLLILLFLRRPAPVMRENFNIINEPPYVPVPISGGPINEFSRNTETNETINSEVINQLDDMKIDDLMAKKNIQLGVNHRIADYGATKSRGNIMRKMFGSDLDHNEAREWWNDRD